MQLIKDARPLAVYLAVGLIQGLTLWAASEAWPHGAVWRALCSALLVFAVIGGWQLQLLWGQLREAGRWKLVLASSLLPAVLAAALAAQFDQPRWYYLDESTGTLLLWSHLVLAYLLTPFIQARQPAHRWRVDYSLLYQHAMNNGLLLFMALIMLAVFWLLILLWAGLFKLVGIGVFETIFQSSGFVWIASAMVCAIGLRIGLERGQVVDALRNVVQAMCRFLLPLTVLILLLFVVCLPFTGLQPLWATRHATPILLTLAFAHIALLNGVVQDGRQVIHYPRLLRMLVDASSLCMPVLAGLATYALWLRIGQYGLTPDRVVASLLTMVAMLHALALAVAVCRPAEGWLDGLRQSNPPLALLSALLLVLLHVPALSPLQLSAANQYQRLLDADVAAEDIDMGALRFQLGEPGRHYLQQLRQRLAEPGLDEARRERLQADLKRLDQVDNYWDWLRAVEVAVAPQVPWIGEPLEDADGSLARAVGSHRCTVAIAHCGLFAVDLNGDEQAEVLLIGDRQSRDVSVLGHDGVNGWRWIGHLRLPRHTLDDEALIERLKSGEFQVVSARFQALQVDGIRLEPMIGD